MPFPLKTLNAFEMTGRIAACEIPATHPGHRAFVGVYQPDLAHSLPQWRVVRFEIRSELVDEHFSQDDMVDRLSLNRATLEEIEDTLRSWGIASSMFDAPWKCDWPL